MSNRIKSALHSGCMSVINAGVLVQEGVELVVEKVQIGALHIAGLGMRSVRVISWMMADTYSLEGFEKWSKAAISQMRMLELIPAMKGVFGECLKTIQGQRDIIYATLVFKSTAEFIEERRDQQGNITGYGFKLPRNKTTGEIDWVGLLYGIGNFFETGKFLQKYKVYSFSQCTRLANQLGSIKLFNLGGQNWTVGNIPVLKTLCDTPKDFLVFFASAYTTVKCFQNRNFWDVENLLKLAGSVGKMVLISTADYMLRKHYLVALCVSDMVTTHASLFAFWIKQNKGRAERGLVI